MRIVLVVAALVAGSARLAAADEPLYTCRPLPATAQISAAFKPEIELADLITWVMGFSCKNIVVAPGIPVRATKVTILAPAKMTPKQAMQLFVDAVESGGLVVQQKPDTIVIKHGPNTPRTCPDIAGKTTPSPTPYVTPTAPPAEDSDADVLAKMAAGIKKLDDTHYEVTRATVDLVTTNPMVFSKGVRVVPAMKDGKPEGFKLYAIRPDSLFARLGFANGDTLRSINGEQLVDAQAGLEIYSKLRTAKRFEVLVGRRDKPVTLVFVIK